jgi:hypothetical protein
MAKKVKREQEPLHMVGDQWRGIMVEMINSSDRAAIIISAAALDALLVQLLRLFLVDDKDTEKLFEYQGPLGSFGARIRMSYYLGLISGDERADLKTIQDMRNDYAHYWLEGSLSEPPTSDACLSLRYANKWAGEMVQGGWSDTPRDRFIVTVAGLVKSLLIRTSSSVFARRCTVPIESSVPPPSAVPPPATGRSEPVTL